MFRGELQRRAQTIAHWTLTFSPNPRPFSIPPMACLIRLVETLVSGLDRAREKVTSPPFLFRPVLWQTLNSPILATRESVPPTALLTLL